MAAQMMNETSMSRLAPLNGARAGITLAAIKSSKNRSRMTAEITIPVIVKALAIWSYLIVAQLYSPYFVSNPQGIFAMLPCGSTKLPRNCLVGSILSSQYNPNP